MHVVVNAIFSQIINARYLVRRLTCHIMKSLNLFTSLVRIKMSKGGELDFWVDRLSNKRSEVISLLRPRQTFVSTLQSD